MALPLLIAAGMAGIRYLQAKEKQKQEKANMLANAEQIRYSPWTGMNSSIQGKDSSSPLLGAASAGLGGYMQGSNIASSMSANKMASDQAAAELAKTQAETEMMKQQQMQPYTGGFMPKKSGYMIG